MESCPKCGSIYRKLQTTKEKHDAKHLWETYTDDIWFQIDPTIQYKTYKAYKK